MLTFTVKTPSRQSIAPRGPLSKAEELLTLYRNYIFSKPSQRNCELSLLQRIANTFEIQLLSSFTYGMQSAGRPAHLAPFLLDLWKESAGECVFYTARARDFSTEILIRLAIEIYNDLRVLHRTTTAQSSDSMPRSPLELLLPGISLDSIDWKTSSLHELSTVEEIQALFATHILNDKGTALLPVRLLAQSSIEGSVFKERLFNPYFDVLEAHHAGTAELSENEIRRLYEHSATTQQLLMEKTYYLKIRDEDQSLLSQVTSLITLLEMNSVGALGTETVFGSAGTFALLHFAQYYASLSQASIAKIPTAVRNQIQEILTVSSTNVTSIVRKCSTTLYTDLNASLFTERSTKAILSTIYPEGFEPGSAQDSPLIQSVKRMEALQKSLFEDPPEGVDHLGFSYALCVRLPVALAFQSERDLNMLRDLSPLQLKSLFGEGEQAQSLRARLLSGIGTLDSMVSLLTSLSATQILALMRSFIAQEFQWIITSAKDFLLLLETLSLVQAEAFLEGLESLAQYYSQKSAQSFIKIGRSSSPHAEMIRTWIWSKGDVMCAMRLLQICDKTEQEAVLAMLKSTKRMDLWSQDLASFVVVSEALRSLESQQYYSEFSQDAMIHGKLTGQTNNLIAFSLIVNALHPECLEGFYASLYHIRPQLVSISDRDIRECYLKSSVLSDTIKQKFTELFFPRGEPETWSFNWSALDQALESIPTKDLKKNFVYLFSTQKISEWAFESAAFLKALTRTLSIDWSQSERGLLDWATLEPAEAGALRGEITGFFLEAFRSIPIAQLSHGALCSLLHILHTPIESNAQMAQALREFFLKVLLRDPFFAQKTTNSLSQFTEMMENLRWEERKEVLLVLHQGGLLVRLAETTERAYSQVGHALLVFGRSYTEAEEYPQPRQSRISQQLKNRLFVIASEENVSIVLEFLALTHTLPHLNLNDSVHRTLLFSAANTDSPHAAAVLSTVVSQAYEESFLCHFEGDQIDRQNRDGDTVLHLAVRAGNRALIQSLFDKHNPSVHIRNNMGERAQDLSPNSDITALFEDYAQRGLYMRIRRCLRW